MTVDDLNPHARAGNAGSGNHVAHVPALLFAVRRRNAHPAANRNALRAHSHDDVPCTVLADGYRVGGGYAGTIVGRRLSGGLLMYGI